MNNFTFAAETIKERVAMPDAIALYAPTPHPKHNRAPCPVHGGTNPNMSFTDKFYHCHKCGAGGDVIHLVQHIFGIPFRAALDKLNTDFSLGLPLDRRPTLREQRDAQVRYKALVAKREQEAAEQQAREEFYWSLWDEWIRLDKNRMEYAPKSPDDELHPLFVEALHGIEHQEYLIDSIKVR